MTPKAKKFFLADMISEMTVENPRKSFDGPKETGTRYFLGKMTAPLKTEW